MAAGLIGRERELADLVGALAEVEAGRGGLRLLIGEPGIGKTRLAEEAASVASERGFCVCWGRAWEAGGAPAYWPVSQALRSLVRGRVGGPLSLAQDLGPGAAYLGSLVPELGIAASAAPDVRDARFLLFEAVLALLRNAGREQPVLLVLDDLHAADPSSLALLAFIARALRELRVLLIGTYRDVEARLSPEIGEPIAKLQRDGRPVPLARLDQAQVGRWVEQALGTLERDTALRVFQLTEGNPLFVDQVLTFAREDGAGRKVPDTVRAVIAERLARLSGDSHALLSIAAVIGRELSKALLVRVAGALEVAAGLAEAAALGLLLERAPGRLLFSHVLVREVLYDALPLERRATLHAAIADALEAMRRADPSVSLAEIAHHALAAGSTEGRALAIERTLSAARAAAGMLAWEESVALADRALEALLLQASPDLSLRAEILLLRSRAQLRAGRNLDARASAKEAAELARALDHTPLFARAALAYGDVYTFGLVDQQLVALLQEARSKVPAGDVALRARLDARYAAAIQPSERPSEPIEFALDAIHAARPLGDKGLLMAVLHDACSALVDFAEPATRAPLDRELAQLALEAGDLVLSARAQMRLIGDAMESGDIDGARREIRGYESLALRLGRPPASWNVPLLHSMLAMREGRFADSERFIAEAEQITSGLDDPNVRVGLLFHRYGLASTAHRSAEMAALEPGMYEVLSALAPGRNLRAAIRAFMAEKRGDRAGVAQAIGEITGDWAPQAAADPNFVYMLAEAAATLADPRVEALWDRLLVLADRNTTMGLLSVSYEGPIRRLLGRVASALGRHDEAERWLREALAASEREGAEPWVARIAYDLGVALLARDQPEHAPEALALFATARTTAERLGMPGLLTMLDLKRDARLSPLMATGDSRASRFPGSGDSRASRFPCGMRREGQDWVIEWQGQPTRVRDARGMAWLARLVAEPGRELHVLDLVGGEGPVDGGDGGAVLDAAAKEAYRARLSSLREEAEEAESFGDAHRAAKTQAEIEALEEELARAIGLFGRDRKQGSAVEKARINVQKRIKDALQKIGSLNEPLGQHLRWAVRTGTYCSYCRDGMPVPIRDGTS